MLYEKACKKEIKIGSADKMEDFLFFWFGEVCLVIYTREVFKPLVSFYSATNNKFPKR